jgi:toxin ParE1/3/4
VTRELIFHRVARADLVDIYDYIAEQSGPVRAGHYLDRIEAGCTGLRDFAEKGVPRYDIAPGVRTWTIERRVLIVYRLPEGKIEILRVLYAGRDFQSSQLPH